MKFIINPFAEIMIKSKPVRKRYLNFLQTNTNLAIKHIDSGLKASYKWDRGEILIDKTLTTFQVHALKKTLSRIPGIENFIEVDQYSISDFLSSDVSDHSELFHYIFTQVQKFYSQKIENKTFAVRVRRVGKHTFSSLDLEKYIGGGLLKFGNNTQVKLKNPDVTVGIEVRDNILFIIKNKYFGVGGYPVGTQDKVLSLISGGFDSGVATYSMMKRGCKVDYLFFNLGGTAHEVGVKQVSQYLRKTFGCGYRASFITVNFESVVAELLTKINHKYRGIILKRLFLQVADSIAKENNYLALIKGDSLGQVSSQTLKNMHAIDKASDTLVLRPLISANKQEIIDISKKIGTYDFACNMPEYCGVISDKPATGAKLEAVLKEEERFNFDLVVQALAEKKIIKIDEIIQNIVDNNIEVEITTIPGEEEIIVDIREDDKKKKDPLMLGELVTKIEIPFFEINHRFSQLDQTKTYLFYCEKGVLSQLHALYLKEQGFMNIKIFRPIQGESSCKI